jgi:hypothetical protein
MRKTVATYKRCNGQKMLDCLEDRCAMTRLSCSGQDGQLDMMEFQIGNDEAARRSARLANCEPKLDRAP